MPDWTIVGSLLLPNAGGWASTLTMIGQVKNPSGTAWYQTIKKPSWNPPNWVFGPAWTIIYTSMGYASYTIFKDCDGFTGQVKNPSGTAWYQTIKKPSWNPPNWVFGPAWTIIYTSMGYASYTVFKDCDGFTGQVKNPSGTAWYQTIKKPSWNPPNWVFGPAWTIIYTSMGYASYTVFKDCDGFTEKAVVPLALYGGQLVLNWFWTPVFFGLHKIGLALLHIMALDAAATACTVSFAAVNKNTLYFMVPYLCWLGFATCLNYSIWQLNKDETDVPLKSDDKDVKKLYES